MQNDALIQTRIPDETAQRLTALANAEGLLVAAWLRRHGLKDVSRMRVEA